MASSTIYTAPHDVRDDAKFEALVELFRSGATVPGIAAYGDDAVCGSHRIAALAEARRQWDLEAEGWEDSPEPELQVVEIDDAEYAAACDLLGVADFDQVGDYNAICEALYAVTDDPALKAVLDDQR